MKHHWNQYANIRKWLYKEQPKHVVEIGALEGENTENLKSLMSDIGYKLTVISDDTEIKDDGVTRIRGVSYREIANLPDNSIDFCILDTDHNYWTMMVELVALKSKMSSNGIIMLHDVDYYYYNSGVSDSYADGSDYPIKEIEEHQKHGGMGNAVIDALSALKTDYRLLLWVPEECGCAVLRRMPNEIIQLTLRPGYLGAGNRKGSVVNA